MSVKLKSAPDAASLDEGNDTPAPIAQADLATQLVVASTNAADLMPPSGNKAQANVAQWLSRKYRVAPEPLSVLVAEAFLPALLRAADSQAANHASGTPS